MKRKVKITKLPNFANGGHTGDQQNYGLYRGGGNLKDYMTGTEDASAENVRVYYPEDKENANVEVEKGELIKDSQGLYKVGGKKHSEGGVKTNVEPGAYVFSDYITMHPSLQLAFGFEASSRKKKDNTIASLLSKKVDAKDYNRNLEILKKAELGEPVDQYALNTAMNRLPDYNKYISRAALAGELSKALMGKEYEIPQLGIPALQEMQKSSRIESGAEQPMAEMEYGGIFRMDDGGENDPGKKIKRSEVAQFLKDNPGYKLVGNKLVKEGTAGSKGKRVVVVEGPPGSIEVEKAIPGDFGRGGYKKWEDWLISQLKRGVTIEELVKKGHGTPGGLEKYRKYYVPVPGVKSSKEEEYDIPPTPPEEVLIEDVPGTTLTTTTPPTTLTTTAPPRKVIITPPVKVPPRPFKQDVLNLLNAASEYTTDVYPVRQALPAVSIDPAFLQPDYAPLQSLALQQSRESSLYGRSPQVQNAVFADIQARTLPELSKLQAAIGAQNIQTDMAARQFNAQMYGQNLAANAQLARQYLEDQARFVDSSDKQRISKRRNVKNAANQLITNVNDAFVYNQMFPQAAFDPWTAMLYQPYGSGMSASSVFNSSSSPSGGNNRAIIDAVEKEVEGIKDEKAKDTYRKVLLNQYYQTPRTSSRAMSPAMFGMMGGMGAGYMNPIIQMAMLQQQQAMNPSLFGDDDNG